MSLPMDDHPASIYILAPAQIPAQRLEARTRMPISLTVEKPSVPVGLDGDRIALIIGRQRLDYYADARWPGELPEVIQYDIIASLRNRYQFVQLGGRSVEGRSAYRLQITVNDFEPVYAQGVGENPTLRVGLVLTLISQASGRVESTFSQSMTRALAGNSLTAVTAGLGEMLRELTLDGFDHLSRNLVP